MKVLILHGWGGSDFPHWQSHLASEVAKNYGTVSFFAFSNPEFPTLDVWRQELITHLEEFAPDIIICHSLANILWFHLCNGGSLHAMKKVQKLYLVAPPRLDCAIGELSTFFPVGAPKELHAMKTLLITSTDDPYLSTHEAQLLQETLGVDMMVLQEAGHINTASGFGRWEWMEREILG